VWNEALDALALALAWIASVLAPDAVLLGGGLAEAGDALIAPLGARLTFQRRPSLLKAPLGDRAASLGSALLAHDLLTARDASYNVRWVMRGGSKVVDGLATGDRQDVRTAAPDAFTSTDRTQGREVSLDTELGRDRPPLRAKLAAVRSWW
jgi:hypothetical protein